MAEGNKGKLPNAAHLLSRVRMWATPSKCEAIGQTPVLSCGSHSAEEQEIEPALKDTLQLWQLHVCASGGKELIPPHLLGIPPAFPQVVHLLHGKCICSQIKTTNGFAIPETN